MTTDTKMADVGTTPTDAVNSRHPVTVEKPIPYTFDLGNLLCSDANPLSDHSEDTLQSIARDCSQVLINQLLTTCDIRSTKDGVLLSLPVPSSLLPREKPVPKPKAPTKWELFAAKKGIKAKNKDGKLVYDNEKGEWVPKWGHKSKGNNVTNEWLVEVNETKTAQGCEADNPRIASRKERVERMRRNERKQRANEARARTKRA